MPRYTFYRVSSDDGSHIATAHYDCDSDDSALAHGMENAGRCAIEIWRGDKKIAFIDGGVMGIATPRLGLDIPDCGPEKPGP